MVDRENQTVSYMTVQSNSGINATLATIGDYDPSPYQILRLK